MEDKQQPKLSSQQLRKIKKPMIERRRRERINDSLNQLKALVLDAMNKEESRYSKMEKADILEMTVKHLKVGQRQSCLSSSPGGEHELVGKYRTGYAECAQEVERYLSTFEDMPPEVRMRLMGHLSGHVEKKMIPQHQMLNVAKLEEMSPVATQLSSLPGSQHPSSPTQSAHVPCVSPVLPLSPASVAPVTVMTAPAPMLVVSPTSQGGGMLKDAIPLYFSGSPGARTMLERESPSPTKLCREEDTRIPRRHCSQELRSDDQCMLKRSYPHLPRFIECKPVHSPVWRPW